MQKLLIKAVSEPKEYGPAKWFEVTDGEGKIYAGTKMEQRTKFVVGQLNEVEIKVVEGKKKPRIELATVSVQAPDIPQSTTPVPKGKPTGMMINTELTKLRSMLVSYGKDLAVVDKIDVADIISHAEVWEGYVLGSAQQPQSPPEAPQSTGRPPEPSGDSVVEEAVELGGEVVPSAEEVKVKVAKLIEANNKLKVGTFVAMMEKLQAGVTEKSEKNKFGKATLVGVYQVLADDNKIKFNKQIGGE